MVSENSELLVYRSPYGRETFSPELPDAQVTSLPRFPHVASLRLLARVLVMWC